MVLALVLVLNTLLPIVAYMHTLFGNQSLQSKINQSLWSNIDQLLENTSNMSVGPVFTLLLSSHSWSILNINVCIDIYCLSVV